MRLEIRERPYDLYTVIVASAVLFLIILVFPNWNVLRIVLGLPFILFFPGYVLISALYPERKRFLDNDGNEVSPPEEDEEIEGDDNEKIKGKGLDGLERVALSLGLSIAITPLIGLVLNYTYDWAPDTLGIRLIPILVSQFSFILIVGIIAVRRRLNVPIEDRFSIILDISIPEDYSTADKILTVGIVVMMVLSVGMLIYIIVVPREGESFTEFYILGPNHKAEGYPRNLLIEDTSFLYIGIGNHEHGDRNYTLVLTVDPGARNVTVSSFDNVTISRSRQPSMEIRVPDGETLEIKCNFSILEAGAFKLRFSLYLDGHEYRDLHIWSRVFPRGYLITLPDNRNQYFIAGPGGDPSLLSSEVEEAQPLPVSIGVLNRGDTGIDFNITLTTGKSARWEAVNISSPILNFTGNNGYFMHLHVNSTSSVAPIDMIIYMPTGKWDLRVTFNSIAGEEEILHRMTVGVD